ncbi:hypothetical protein [Streptomyces sp. NPDC059783]|uniref:hypothetical protein n=1 Tax=Streptomyces sp. NPDC059783 TaxID=3346944 RepID=UPI0036672C75
MNRKFAEIGSTGDGKDVVFDITPDLADAFVDAIRNRINVQGPRHAQTFDDLTATIAQTSRLIQHLQEFRELAIAAADRTSPHADRKAIAIAAAMPPSRLYRVLEKHGRPADRKQGETQKQALQQSVHAVGGEWDPQRVVTVLADAGHEVTDKRARQLLRDLAAAHVITKTDPNTATYRTAREN